MIFKHSGQALKPFPFLFHGMSPSEMSAGLQKSLQPCSQAARKWRENEEMKRKWRKNEEIERKWKENEETERE